MTGRMMVLAAGLALMVVPQAAAQEAEQEAAQEAAETAETAHKPARAGHGHTRMDARMRHRAPGGERSFDRAVGRLMDRRYELNLSDDQMAKLDGLREDARSAMAPIREEMGSIHEGLSDGSLTREDAHERMESVHEKAAAMATDQHEKLGEILEPEQQQMLDHGMAHHGSRHGAGRHGHPGRMGHMGRMGRHGGDRGH